MTNVSICPTPLSVAVINTRMKSNLGRKRGLVWLSVPGHSLSPREGREEGNSNGNLRQKPWRHAACWLTGAYAQPALI